MTLSGLHIPSSHHITISVHLGSPYSILFNHITHNNEFQYKKNMLPAVLRRMDINMAIYFERRLQKISRSSNT